MHNINNVLVIFGWLQQTRIQSPAILRVWDNKLYSTFTRSSNWTTKGSSVRMARCLSSDTDSWGGSKPTAENQGKKNQHIYCQNDSKPLAAEFILIFILTILQNFFTVNFKLS